MLRESSVPHAEREDYEWRLAENVGKDKPNGRGTDIRSAIMEHLIRLIRYISSYFPKDYESAHTWICGGIGVARNQL